MEQVLPQSTQKELTLLTPRFQDIVSRTVIEKISVVLSYSVCVTC